MTGSNQTNNNLTNSQSLTLFKQDKDIQHRIETCINYYKSVDFTEFERLIIHQKQN